MNTTDRKIRPKARRSNAERFWAKVEKSRSCWEWTAAVDHAGYGVFTWAHETGHRTITAHRAVYLLTHGSIPKGDHIMHACDNPGCVNPEHLFAGSHADNMADKVAKGRQPSGSDVWHLAKLTPPKVLSIRKWHAKGKTQTWLAAKYGVSQHCIWNVIHRRTWKHVA